MATDVQKIVDDIVKRQDDTFMKLKEMVVAIKDLANDPLSEIRFPEYEEPLSQYDPYAQFSEAEGTLKEIINAAPELADFEPPDAPTDPDPPEFAVGAEDITSIEFGPFEKTPPDLDLPQDKPTVEAAKQLEGLSFDSFDIAPPRITIGQAPTINAAADLDRLQFPSFTKSPPQVNLPQTPQITTPSLPQQPHLQSPTMPDAPAYVLPSAVSLSQILLPTPPQIALPSFSSTAPAFDLAPPTVSLVWSEQEYDSDLLDEITTQLFSDLHNGGYGINTADEQAVWSRAREREEAKARADEESLKAEFAGRGFSLPPGAMFKALGSLRQSVREAVNGLSRETAIKRYDQLFEARKFAMQQGVSLENMLISYHGQRMERSLNFARSYAEVAITVYNASLATFNAKLEAYKTETQAFEALLRAEVEKVNLYRAQLDAAKTIAEIDRNKLQLYTAQLQGVETLVRIYSERMNGAKIFADIENLKMQGFKSQIDAYVAQVNAGEAQVRLYDAQVRGETSKLQSFTAEVAAYEAQVKGESAKAAAIGEAIRGDIASVNAYEAQIRAEVARLDAYKNEVAAYQAKISGKEAQVRAIGEAIRGDVANISAYEAQVRAEVARLEAFKSEVAAYQAEMQGKESQVRALAEAVKASNLLEEAKLSTFKVGLERYKAEIEVESARVQSNARNYEAKARASEAYAKIQQENGRFYTEKARAFQSDKFKKFDTSVEKVKLDYNKLFQNRDIRISTGKWETEVWKEIAGSALASLDGVVAQVKEE